MLKNVFESHTAYGIIWFPCDFKSSCENIMKASLILPIMTYDGFPFSSHCGGHSLHVC